jgi:dTDP-4-amino-4,6-dideoxygalactose transaminase
VSWVPFNRPQLAGGEHVYIDEALASGKLSGNGEFGQRCASWLEHRVGASRVLMTPSCTASLDMAALLSGVGVGDEVIVPSYTFVSTANAFALRGAVPVFADVRPDTLNVASNAVADAITDRTRAIVVVHYGGVGCEMESIMELAERRNLVVIEDAAHALPATYGGRPLGSFEEPAVRRRGGNRTQR